MTKRNEMGLVSELIKEAAHHETTNPRLWGLLISAASDIEELRNDRARMFDGTHQLIVEAEDRGRERALDVEPFDYEAARRNSGR